MDKLRVNGYDVLEMLGAGASGEVWLARELATGDPVALKRLRATAPGPVGIDGVRREAAILAALSHPHVVAFRAVVSSEEGAAVLVLAHAAGGSLERLVGARGRLMPPEVITLATPLAQALAAVHARGVVHGDVTPNNVLFAADGRPLLSDLGVARLLGAGPGVVEVTPGFADPAVVAGGQPGPASDVHGLAATCFAALSGRAPYGDAHHAVGQSRPPTIWPPDTPPALRRLLERGLSEDPDLRPTASQFAAEVFGCGPAAPIRLALLAEGPGSAGEGVGAVGAAELTRPVSSTPRATPEVGRPVGSRRRRRAGHMWWRALRRPVVRRVIACTVAAACGLGVAAVAGLAWAGSGEPRPGGGVQPVARLDPPVPEPSWAELLAGLDARRSAAFASGDGSALRGVYSPGAPAWARDRRKLLDLSRSGLRARGMRLVPSSVTVIRAEREQVILQVVDVLLPYDVVSEDGSPVQRHGGRPAATWRVHLRRAGPAWQVYDVTRGPGP